MGIFNKLDRAIILNENTIVERYITKLEELEKLATGNLKEKIKQEINCCKFGANGEKQIIFELKNSNIPMFVIHDYVIKDGENIAQIDFLIITKKLIYVVEVKNLVGDICIDNRGRFTRKYLKNGHQVVESIYSPITQNQRHMEILKNKRKKSKNFFLRYVYEKNFDNVYKNLVVITNPKSVIKDKYATNEVKGKVIRADELVEYIRRENKKSSEAEISDKELVNITETFVDMREKTTSLYIEKYYSFLNELKKQDKKVEVNKELIKIELKKYRCNKSLKENIKPYFIFKDSELEELLVKLPKSKDELMNVKGFNNIKVSKYGEDIVNIINK